MRAPINETLVMDIAGRVALVVTKVAAVADVLTRLGFVRHSDRWERAVIDDDDRRALVTALVDLDVLFCAGHDWSPQALVEYYRETGVIRNEYRSIAWHGPDLYAIERHVNATSTPLHKDQS